VPPARWITAVTAVWAALLAMWLVLTPAYSGFDEAQHVDMVTVCSTARTRGRHLVSATSGPSWCRRPHEQVR